MTTTDEQFVSDNSISQNETVSLSDREENSQASTFIQSENEPEIKTNEAVNKADSFQEIEIPEKFRNKDGSANLASLVKSYKELEPLINEKAKWGKEKALLTSQLSKFQTKNTLSDLSKISVNFLEENIAQSSDSEKANSLIEQFKTNPSEEIINELESLFPSDIVKSAYLNSMETSRIAAQIELQQLKAQEFHEAESYLKTVVEKNFDALKNPVAADIFSETFNRFGVGLDSNWFFSKLQQLKDSIILDYQKSQSLESEKKSAISTASKLSPDSNAKGGTSLLQRNALELSPQELDRMLDEFYDK